MPFNSVRACPEDSKKLPLRGKTSPAPGQILPGRGEMSPQVTKRGTDVTVGDKRVNLARQRLRGFSYTSSFAYWALVSIKRRRGST